MGSREGLIFFLMLTQTLFNIKYLKISEEQALAKLQLMPSPRLGIAVVAFLVAWYEMHTAFT